MANTWQGTFPVENTVADGYRYTAPGGSFPATSLGLFGMSGNVWEWTASWFRPYAERGEPFTPTEQSQRVQRGGSFLCNECGGWRVFSRSHSTPETSLFHVGFRCAIYPKVPAVTTDSLARRLADPTLPASVRSAGGHLSWFTAPSGTARPASRSVSGRPALPMSQT